MCGVTRVKSKRNECTPISDVVTKQNRRHGASPLSSPQLQAGWRVPLTALGVAERGVPRTPPPAVGCISPVPSSDWYEVSAAGRRARRSVHLEGRTASPRSSDEELCQTTQLQETNLSMRQLIYTLNGCATLNEISFNEF